MTLGVVLVRLVGGLLVLSIGWTLLNAYALPAFLLFTAVAGWRLYRAATILPDARPGRGPRFGADRAPPPDAGQPGKAEVRKLIDVLAAERERARLGHKGEPAVLHCVFLGEAGQDFIDCANGMPL